ncbi:MAG: hypothetical protein L7F78_03475, partial [Syntrophales bacterium LBB04]|nr:hypothetical protein [Syntrophales bacterium LBB04]
MVEIIAVMVIIGIMAAMAAGRFISTGQDLTSETGIVRSHLRFAQLKALNDDTATWGIAFSNDHYTLKNGSADATISLPSENSSTHSFSAGVTSSNTTVNFDSWGSPGTNNITITLSQNLVCSCSRTFFSS